MPQLMLSPRFQEALVGGILHERMLECVDKFRKHSACKNQLRGDHLVAERSGVCLWPSQLHDYWRKALETAKEVRFEIVSVGVGSNAITIVYRNHRNDHVAETLVFCENGKVIEGVVTYLKPSGLRRYDCPVLDDQSGNPAFRSASNR